MGARGRMEPIAAVVLSTLAAPRDPELDILLGDARAAALREALALRARRWAARVAGDAAYEATSVGAAGVALHDHSGPVVMVAPDVPFLWDDWAPLVRADLEDGALVVIGPSTDGSPFLVAVPSAEPEALEFAGATFEQLAGDPRLTEAGIGMLRSERRLVTVSDARAFVADPLADPELLEHLAPALT
jgi:hypothetical protein